MPSSVGMRRCACLVKEGPRDWGQDKSPSFFMFYSPLRAIV